MFHLLVKYSGWAASRDSLTRDRVFEYTDDDLVKEFKPLGKLDSEKISRIPAIFLTETGGSNQEIARVGRITKTRLNGKEVDIEYSYDSSIPPIPNEALQKVASELGIESFEFSRSHWAIKDADLFEALLKIRSVPNIAPKVFKLNDPPKLDKNLVSVMMPFDSKFDKVYEALKGMAKSLRMKCSRADDIWKHDAVIQDIVSLIEQSRVVICDCSGRNANVFYEIGIAHSLGKDVILITQSDSDIPFDLRHLRYVPYLNNEEGRGELVEKLSKRIDTLLTLYTG